ncbi:MAG: ECF transporter S component [Peptococcaceae bacterium]|jgi:riboflavin transporter FmnP|nr:ECF transporter S component [Peptococcaceae bacterium]
MANGKNTEYPEKKFPVPLLTKMALLTATAVVFSFIPGFPIIPAVGFIRYEFADLPVLIGVFAFGTLPGAGVAAASVFISYLVGAEGGGPWGALMHLIAIGTYALTAGAIYHFNKTRRGAIIGMIAGTAAMTLVMIPANLVITPIYTRAPVEAVKSLLLPGIIPVNAAKGLITAALTFVIYKRVSGYLH